MKKILIAFFVLFVMALAGFYYYIANLDWNQHKDKIAGQIMSSTGKKVVFDGQLSFSIFPQPYLQAKDVRIYNGDDNIPLAKAPSLVAKLELLPLFKGAINVKSMTLVDPTLNFTISKDGHLNWEQSRQIEDFGPSSEKLELNNAMLKNAKIEFVDEHNDINFVLENVTTEVYVEGLSGPYRFEGNFVKNNETFNFVFAVGTHLDGYATPLNIALIHAPSESYIRFDGSTTIENNALTGDIIAESKFPLALFGKIYDGFNLDEKYNVPLVITSELKSNRSRIDFANFVIKYGQNIGAGNILIPAIDKNVSSKEQKKQKIEALFEMTDLDMDLISGYIKDKIDFYREKENIYAPDFKYDLAFDLKSLKTFYKNQELQDFSVSMDIKDDVFVLKNMTVIAPGNSRLAARGKVFSENEKPAYNLDVAFVSDNFEKMLSWLAKTPEIVAPATYKSAQAAFNMSGNLQDIKFSPVKFNLDKMEFTSTVNYISDIRDSWYVDIETANIVNFDNYIKPLDKDYQASSFIDRLLERFKQVSLLNDKDLFIEARFAGAVWDKIPFGKTELSAEIINGKMDLKNLQINDFHDANVTISGILSGFNDKLLFENLNYDIEAKDFTSFWDSIKITDYFNNLKKKEKLLSHGVLNGSVEDLQIKSVTAIGDTDIVYDGTIKQQEENVRFAGDLEIRSTDFSKFMEDFFQNNSYNFLPKSLFHINTKIEGVPDEFAMSGLNTFIGMTNITGYVTLSLKENKPSIKGNVYFATLDLSNFIYSKKDSKNKTFEVRRKSINVPFLNKPVFSKADFDYSLFKAFDFDGRLEAAELKFDTSALHNVSTHLQFSDEKLQVDDLNANIAEEDIKGKFSIDLADKNELDAEISVTNQSMEDIKLDGYMYGFVGGTADISAKFKSIADSVAAVAENFEGEVSFIIKNTAFKGLDLMPVYEDLLNRETSEGLREIADNSKDTGSSDFSEISGKMLFDKNGFSFEDTNLTSDNYVAGLTGSGNLKDWNMDTKMEISFPNLLEMPSLYFDLSGSMANPQSSINVEKIVEKYDRERQQLLDEIKRRNEEKEQQIRESFSALAAQLKQVEDKINSNVIPSIQLRESKSKYQATKDVFLQAEEKAQQILSEIKQFVDIEEREKITEGDILLVDGKYDEFMKRISDIEESIAGIYENETKQEYEALYDENIELYKKTKEQINSYQGFMEKYKYDASNLKPALDFDKDKKYNELNQKIENEYLSIDRSYSKIINEYSESDSDTPIEQMEKSNAENIMLLTSSKDNLKTLIKYIGETLEYVRKQIDYAKDPALKIADEKKAAEEAARKAAEEEAARIAKLEEEKAAKIVQEEKERDAISQELAKMKKEANENKDDDLGLVEAIKSIEETFIPEDDSQAQEADSETSKKDRIKLSTKGKTDKQPVGKEKESEPEEIIVEKPKFEMRAVSGEIKEATGTVRRADAPEVKEEPVKTPKKPSFLRKVIGEIKEATGTFLKKD